MALLLMRVSECVHPSVYDQLDYFQVLALLNKIGKHFYKSYCGHLFSFFGGTSLGMNFWSLWEICVQRFTLVGSDGVCPCGWLPLCIAVFFRWLPRSV